MNRAVLLLAVIAFGFGLALVGRCGGFSAFS